MKNLNLFNAISHYHDFINKRNDLLFLLKQETVNPYNRSQFNYGEWIIENEKIIFVCLGYAIVFSTRVIKHNDSKLILEIKLSHSKNNKEITIGYLYMNRRGDIFINRDDNNSLTSLEDINIKQNLSIHIAEAVFNSEIII